MRLLIVRHAEAAPGKPDELRALTPGGREQARRLGRRLRELGARAGCNRVEPTAPRTRDGGGSRRSATPEVDDRLAPGASPSDVREAALGRGETVLLVGHQPDCGRAAAALSGGPEPAFPPVRARARRAGARLSAIAVRGLRKSYGELEAVRGVDFEIEQGEVFGLLGPNGAGKTTTVEILEGYRRRDAGEVSVLGHDPQSPGPRLPRANRRRPAAIGALAEPHRARDAQDLRRLLRAPP